MDRQLKELLEFDPIYEIETLVEKSKNEELKKDAQGLAFLTSMTHSKLVQANLKQRGDTYMSMPLIDFIEILIVDGCTCIYEEEFKDDKWDERVRTERLCVYWNDKDGLLVVFDTYDDQKTVNGASVRYNYKPLDNKIFFVTA